jgi:diguanylate cyclase (GGDEF)-like protein
VLLTTQMEAFPGGVALVDANMKITSHNRKFLDMWEIPAPDGRPDWDERAFERVRSYVKALEPFRTRANYLYAHPEEDSQDDIELIDGRVIDRYTVAIRTAAGAYLGRMWFFRDVTEHRAALAEAQRLARRDVLTGLANRAVFMESLRQSLAKARRSGRSFAVIYLDIDHFKQVNDTLGHGVGDEILKAVAERLRTHMRETDTVARLGGDEFALIAADFSTPKDVEVLSAKLVELTAEPFVVGARRIQVGASIGVALYEPQASDAETLLSHADQALYQAKAAGRGQSRFFSSAQDGPAASART